MPLAAFRPAYSVRLPICSTMREALATADRAAPCVLWIDEIEKGLASNSSDNSVTRRLIGQFLFWMQESTSKVFLVATSNDVSTLPPELLRKGRFDEIFFVDLPAPDERAQIWELHVRKHIHAAPHHAGFAFDDALRADLVLATEGFSGAEIEQAVIAGLFDAFSERRDITGDDLRLAVERSVPLSVTQAESLAALRAWAGERAVSASDNRVETSPHAPDPMMAPAGVDSSRARYAPAGRRVEF